MRTFDELMKRVGPYKTLYRIFDEDIGYIVWRLASGDNIELLFIEAKEPGKGHGKELVRRMVRSIEANGPKPYHSVCGFRLGSNKESMHFYHSLGFQQVNLCRSIYGGDDTVVFWIPWDDLRKAAGCA